MGSMGIVMPPVSVMRIANTEAKTGRSMKKLTKGISPRG